MANHAKGTPREKRALAAYVKLRRADETLTAHLKRGIGKSGLTESQYFVLDALYHLGPLCQRDLAGKLLRTSGNITMVIDNLEKRGLALRQRARKDRRMMMVSLTPKGKRTVNTIFPVQVKVLADLMGTLSAAEQDELARLCRKLGLQGA